MDKKLMTALIILALSVIVLLFNKGRVDVNIIFTTLSGMKSLVFLSFISIGVIIGVLLK
jgi:hypothetical protein